MCKSFDQIFSKFQRGFRKGFSTQNCLLYMTENWKESLDQGGHYGALLTDLSKAFDCIMHDLLIAKLQAYGFDNDSLNFICNYLVDREQRVKINSSFSTWSKIEYGVPQGSILGPLLFNINTLDMFFEQKDVNIAAYADDNTPYICDKNLEALLSKLQICTLKLIEWFSKKNIKLNRDVINNTQAQKLLGVHIDHKLKFDTDIETLSKKVRKKLHVLARIIIYMPTNQAQLLMRSFIMSQFGYCLLIWMCHSRKVNNQINKLHERDLRLVYNDKSSSFQELFEADNSVTIHEKNIQLLPKEIFKVKRRTAEAAVHRCSQEKVF